MTIVIKSTNQFIDHFFFDFSYGLLGASGLYLISIKTNIADWLHWERIDIQINWNISQNLLFNKCKQFITQFVTNRY